MKKTLFKTREISYQTLIGSAECKLEYYILEERYEGIDVYGLEIHKIQQDNTMELEAIRHITADEREIQDMAIKLCSHSVMPSTMVDVIHDDTNSI